MRGKERLLPTEEPGSTFPWGVCPLGIQACPGPFAEREAMLLASRLWRRIRLRPRLPAWFTGAEGLGLGTTSHFSAAPATQCLPRVGWGWGLDQGQQRSGLGASLCLEAPSCFVCYSLLRLDLLGLCPNYCIKIMEPEPLILSQPEAGRAGPADARVSGQNPVC